MLVAGSGAAAMSSTNIVFGGIFNPWQVAGHTAMSTIFTGIRCYTESHKIDSESSVLSQSLPYAVDVVVVAHILHNPMQAPEHIPQAMHAINVATTTLRSVVIADQSTKLGIDLVDTVLAGDQDTATAF